MRYFLAILFVCLSNLSASEARECRLPSPDLNDIGGQPVTYNFLTCMMAEIGDLKAEQLRLKSQLDRLQKKIGDLPGEFRNENGKISKPDGPTIGSASFLLSARQEISSASLPIDQSVMEGLCGRKGGCLVSVFFEAEGMRLTDTTETIAVGPCALSYNTTSGAWARGNGCGDEGAASGTDGNGSPTGGGGDEIVTVAGDACLLSDADAARSVGGGGVLGADGSRGFFLVAAPSLRKAAGGRFKCELKIE